MSNEFNILIGVTGSVAAIKTESLVESIIMAAGKYCLQVNVKLIVTKNAKYFTGNVKDLGSKLKVEILEDEDEWSNEAYQRNDSVLHIELRKWADLLLIAPLDANTLAKMANGICDNLLTCVVRCWDPKKAIFLAPAMNTMMWDHPITADQLKTITGWGFNITLIPPVTKLLACGDYGTGGMESIDEIVRIVYTAFDSV